ncbi:MAG TPA: hypothetical protein VFH74_00030 [Gaiellales bacterium]|nr:hypothetical protein [Gaiellales bacterium]
MRRTRVTHAGTADPPGGPAADAAGPDAVLLAGDVVTHRFAFGAPGPAQRRLVVARHQVVYVGRDGTATAFAILDLTGLRATARALGVCFRCHAPPAGGGSAGEPADRHVVLSETVPLGMRSTFELEIALAEAWIRQAGRPFPAADLAGCGHLTDLGEPGLLSVRSLGHLGAA